MTAALTWTRANGERYGIDPDFFRKQDIHIHVPSGAVPKDGPSAGAAMVTALVSLLSGRPVKDRLAIDRRDDALGRGPAHRRSEGKSAGREAGRHHARLLPADNEPNVVADLTPEILGDIKITYVRTLDESSGTRAPEGSGDAADRAAAGAKTEASWPGRPARYSLKQRNSVADGVQRAPLHLREM